LRVGNDATEFQLWSLKHKPTCASTVDCQGVWLGQHGVEAAKTDFHLHVQRARIFPIRHKSLAVRNLGMQRCSRNVRITGSEKEKILSEKVRIWWNTIWQEFNVDWKSWRCGQLI